MLQVTLNDPFRNRIDRFVRVVLLLTSAYGLESSILAWRSGMSRSGLRRCKASICHPSCEEFSSQYCLKTVPIRSCGLLMTFIHSRKWSLTMLEDTVRGTSAQWFIHLPWRSTTRSPLYVNRPAYPIAGCTPPSGFSNPNKTSGRWSRASLQVSCPGTGAVSSPMVVPRAGGTTMTNQSARLEYWQCMSVPYRA